MFFYILLQAVSLFPVAHSLLCVISCKKKFFCILSIINFISSLLPVSTYNFCAHTRVNSALCCVLFVLYWGSEKRKIKIISKSVSGCEMRRKNVKRNIERKFLVLS